MLKKILLTIVLFVFTGVLVGLAFLIYQERQKLIGDISRLSSQDRIRVIELVKLQEQITLLEWEHIEDQRYLTYSGTLHYVSLDWVTDTTASGFLMANSYDAIRFHNITSDSITLHIYDTEDRAIPPLSSLEIKSGAMNFFSLKKSGMYIYRVGEQKWVIIIGQEYLDRYNLDSFLKKEIFPLFDAKDPSSIKKALLHFKEITMSNALISKNCHNLAHDIWHESFEKYGFSIAISGGQDDVCAWWYTHGVLESYFESEPLLREDPESACSSIEGKKKGSCFHGVGHWLMFISGNDIATSLDWCQKLSSPVWKNRCAEWVFMELYSWDPKHALWKIAYSTWELFAPCTMYASGSTGYVCGFYAGLGYLRYASEDYRWALTACEAWWVYTPMCIRWVGREIAKRYIGDALKLENICSHLPKQDAKRNCIEWGISYTKLQFDDDPNLIEWYCRGFQSFWELCTGKKTEETSIWASGWLLM